MLFLSNVIKQSNRLLTFSEETGEGENIMGSIAEFVIAMATLGILRSWNAREDERNFRREEEFVPFRLPPLSRQDQSIQLPEEEITSEVALASCVSH
jgi:hypothetical protein